MKANINIQPDKLKLLLPILAYYMVSKEDTVFQQYKHDDKHIVLYLVEWLRLMSYLAIMQNGW